METVEDPILGICTVIPNRAGTSVWPLSFIAMGIAGPSILAAWFLGHADFDARIVVMGFLGTFMTPMIPASAKSLHRPYYAMVGPNGFAAPDAGRIIRIAWSDVSDFGLTFYRGKPVRLNLELSRPRPLSLSTQLANYFGLLERDAASKVSFALKGSTLPQEELFGMFVEHITAAKEAAAGLAPTEALETSR